MILCRKIILINGYKLFDITYVVSKFMNIWKPAELTLLDNYVETVEKNGSAWIAGGARGEEDN